MNRLCFFAGLVICLSVSVASAQTGKEHTVPLFFEKAYLHTDRPVYGQGEDIWFKAYVVNAQNNAPINYSHNLYVELVSSSSKIMNREMIRLENGLGNGDFKLSDSIPAGHYRLRAYTNWMRNFGDNFVFEKHITILQTKALTAIAPKNRKSGGKSAAMAGPAITNKLPAIRFFPEGGSLIQGISSFVGVKAEDSNGKGIPASAAVISSAGDTISHFTCDSLGMGLFTILPIAGQSYKAITDHIGSFELPAALSKGLNLQVRQTDSVTHILISNAGQEQHGAITLVIKHEGKTQLNKLLLLQNQHASANIPANVLPEGISAITLYNAQGKPECERLVYIQHSENNHQNRVIITTDKKSDQSKERAVISISAPVNSNLSMAAVDAGAFPMQNENIVSYLDLQSEIKGNIESPNRYFDTTNVNRFKQLDLLLLTQGWRNFVWKRIEDTTLKISYEPEQGITITGRVRRAGANKPLPGIDVTMRAPKAEGQKLFWATTDSAGRFAIYNTKFYGYQYFSFTSRKSDKINKSGEGKGHSGGFIQVDSLVRDTLPIGPDRQIADADTAWKAQLAIGHIKTSQEQQGVHSLKEVTIKGFTNHLVPEIHPITLAEQKDYDNLAQYLLYMIDGAKLGYYLWNRTMLSRYIIQHGKYGHWVELEGSYANGTQIKPGEYPDEDFLTQPMRNIVKVIFNKNRYGDIITVSLIIRNGVMEPKDFFDNTTADMTGYYKAREFYKPTQEELNNNLDTRINTLHWEPNITTNDKGEATVTFYNTTQAGKMCLITEGITADGTPLAATITYEVK